MSVPSSISSRIKRARISAGLTGRQLAAEAGLSAVTISRIERGHSTPTVATLQALSEALGVSLASLTGDAP